MRRKSRISMRAVFLFAVFTAGLAAVFSSLAKLYIPDNTDTGSNQTESVVRIKKIPASRGEIYDRNGKELVGNKVTYTLEFDYSEFDRERRCTLIDHVITLLDEHNISYRDTLPISDPPYKYTFIPDSREEKNMNAFLSYRGLDPSISAQDSMIALCESYNIPARYHPKRAKQIIGVFYEMYLSDFSPYNPYVMAQGLDEDTINIISVQKEKYKGINIGVDYDRCYNTDLCAHILGRTGPIPKAQVDGYIEKGYPINAQVGIDGAEYAFEDILRALPGETTAEIDEKGNTVGIISQKDPVSGKNIFLTIDLDLQEAAENSLNKHISSLREDGGEDAGGAAVALDPNSGEILLLASYPVFSLKDFYQNYTDLLSDPLRPMFNRAIAGTYAPGSTFKMVTATAALKSGIITPETLINCEGVYTYYAPDYLYHCWLYTDTGKTHGHLSLTQALAQSCNCFFYEAGRLCGIDRIAQCASLFGLGQKTGIELVGEADGCVASAQIRQERGLGFYPGDTLQAAIGQSDTLVTPIQLASYVSAVVNGGDRYTPHILLRTQEQSSKRICFEKEPVLSGSIEYTNQDLNAILDGMRSVTLDGTAKHVFDDYPLSLLGKSGSAQTGSGDPNAIFVLAAPAEKPEIVIAVVIEHGKVGNNAALVARDILDAFELGKKQIKNKVID